jgi:hypothetical protein
VKGLALVLAAVAVAAVSTTVSAAAPTNAGAPEPTQTDRALVAQETARGFFRGRTIRYLDFGPIKLAAGNDVEPIWVVTNGTAAQHNIIDTVPGRDDYTPLWRVTMVTWRDGATRRTLKSAATVRAAQRAGQVTLRRTSIVVNCPVLGFGQERTPGFAKGERIQYLDLGPLKLRPGNKVAPIWVVTNGMSEQHNVIDVLPGDPGYTPLWRVRMVTWKEGVAPRTLRSADEVEAALAAGEVTIQQTSTVVNCPVV